MTQYRPLINGRLIDMEVVDELGECPHCGVKYHYESEISEESYHAYAVCACDRLEF